MTYLRSEQGRVVRAKTYGGLLTENIVQAISRDVLVDAQLRLDRAGFPVVLHVHDENVAEVDDEARFEEMKALEDENKDLEERLETRKVVDRAKGKLMDELDMKENDAFRWVQRRAMDERTSMRDVAQRVLDGSLRP
jgi:hypothetical protein